MTLPNDICIHHNNNNCRTPIQFWNHELHHIAHIDTIKDSSHKSHNKLNIYSTMHHFVTETWAHFCYKVVHCWIWDWCIVRFVQQVYCRTPVQFWTHERHPIAHLDTRIVALSDQSWGAYNEWYWRKLRQKRTELYHTRGCIVYLQVSSHLTHRGRDKMATVSQTTLSNAFSWMKMLEFRLRFHWSLFLRVQLTIFQHWFR